MTRQTGQTSEDSVRASRRAASPRARRAMAALGIDPAAVQGSGPDGRIVEADVLRARPGSAPQGAQIQPVRGSLATDRMRMAIARRTAESFATVPHFYLRAELDAMALLQARQDQLESVERNHGVRLTVTDFLLCALAKSLADCPWANSVWQDGLVKLPTVDVGLMVALDNGLLAPMIRRADELSLVDLAKQRAHLVEAARTGKLPASALGGGAATLSNLGNTVVDEFAAIILPPQSSMLAAGRCALRPYVVDGRLVVRSTLKLCLSADHRVMDGLTAARFLGKIVERLEKPSQLLAQPEGRT